MKNVFTIILDAETSIYMYNNKYKKNHPMSSNNHHVCNICSHCVHIFADGNLVKVGEYKKATDTLHLYPKRIKWRGMKLKRGSHVRFLVLTLSDMKMLYIMYMVMKVEQESINKIRTVNSYILCPPHI